LVLLGKNVREKGAQKIKKSGKAKGNINSIC